MNLMDWVSALTAQIETRMMGNLNSNNELPECRGVQTLISDYIENTLSARETWNVEKHLADCGGCSDMLHQMQATVQLLRAAPRRDTAHDFMAQLHARLDGVEPEAMRTPSRLTAFRDWLSGLGTNAARGWRLPALGLSFSAVALTAIVAAQQFAPRTPAVKANIPVAVSPPAAPSPAVPVEQLRHNTALSSSPFDDPAAANLQEHSGTEDNDTNGENDTVSS